MPLKLSDTESCVDAILERLGSRIVLGVPLGIGKPNALLNALYTRAKRDPQLRLDIVTALSLNPPRGKAELEERFYAPIRERVWPNYPRLSYLDDLEANALPDNVRVLEFYLRAGAGMGCEHSQQHYLSSNYTMVARDMMARGVNLVMQAVALREQDGQRRYSLSSNPDVTLELLPMLRDSGRPWLGVAQVNRELPWLGNRAEFSEDEIHILLDHPALDHAPFAVPHEPVDTTAWAIGLYASALVRDGGTLQVGIGALGDAACHALLLRERENARYREALGALGGAAPALEIGGDQPFEQGLYVASELISNPLFALFEAGIVRRRVFEDEAGQRSALERPREVSGGTCLQGAFFVGPRDFYRRLHRLPEEQRALIDMTSVAEVNRIYTDYRLERLQRRHARFINMTIKVSLLGAAVSDQLANGQVVSGVGGQHDFVSMAHQLPDGRSVLLCRASASRKGELSSNLVWQFPHTTIPRHQRDLFITEYGVADLRAKSDSECIEALLNIADSRFQEQLLREAKAAGKIARGHRIPDRHRQNVPERIARALAPFERAGELPRFPFGSDLTPEEWALAGQLKRLQAATATNAGRARLVRALVSGARRQRDEELEAALQHLGLERPRGPKELLLARLVEAAFAL